ncbi:hypothetical protein BDB01DRAFT_843898 [Pilobolus umbonatus]|nr:hypothetical protein BDB01DRAFT_843898 [Pilobolus umbonatus]
MVHSRRDDSPTVESCIQPNSIYHKCCSVLDRLSLVHGLTDYMETEMDINHKTPIDPLSKLAVICRQAFPLCTLYNTLNPDKQLKYDNATNLNAINLCKANVYHFIVACRNELSFPEEDMFSISDLFQDDTNGFVKVLNTVDKLLQRLEDHGIITVRSSNRNSDPNAPKNTRDKVVQELLETERRYVLDMEYLQTYMRELNAQRIVSADTIHYLFGNLHSLVDFQRRFLIQLEEVAEKSPEEQRIGSVFIQMEESFSVYEPYCANYYSAQDLVVQETPRLLKMAEVINPIYQLPSFLIKPVQRICKYPLLLQKLCESTDKEWPHYHETEQALEAIKRVADKVNETQRQHENLKIVEELRKRLDCHDLSLNMYGPLLLQDKLLVTTSSDHERELHIYFFEKVLLLCKESKGNNLLPKTNTLSINRRRRRSSLALKRITQTSAIVKFEPSTKNNMWMLQLSIQSDNATQKDMISLKFKNEELLKLWTSALGKIKDSVSPHMETQHCINYDEEDEEDVGISEEFGRDEEDDEEEDYSGNRSSSFNTNHRIKMMQTQSTESWKHPGRPSYNTPGLNLSPLPRSNSSLTTASTTSLLYQHYPVSPPPSHPSSPTTSSRASSSSTHSHTWNTGHVMGEMTPNSSNEMSDDSVHMLSSGRSKSHSATLDAHGKVILHRSPTGRNRLRSQSSPNIMKNGFPKHPGRTEPDHLQYKDPLFSQLKVKLKFGENFYSIVADYDITYCELMSKVDKKIRLIANLKPTDILRLKYKDEDSDHITISSDDDVQMALESRGAETTVNLFVSL